MSRVAAHVQVEKAGKALTQPQGSLLLHAVNVLAKYFIAEGSGLEETTVKVQFSVQ